MDTAADDIVTLLRDAARTFCAEAVTRFDTDAKARDGLWKEIAGLGWPGVAIGEAHGGSASGLVAAAVIACELGRAGLTRGYAETVAIAAALERAGLQSGAAVADLLSAVAQGTQQLACLRPFADARDPQALRGMLPDAGAARLGVLTWTNEHGLCLHELDAAARGETIRTTSRATDLTVDLAHAQGAAAPGMRVLASAVAGRPVWDEVRVLHGCMAAAQLVGAVQAALGLGVNYARVRSQFGHLIGAYQAVQHTLVDILAASDAAEMLVFRALAAIQSNAADRVSLAASATAFARETAWTGMMKTYDVLGGVGFIEEHPVNRLTRAVLSVIASIGSASECEDAVAAQVRRGHWVPHLSESRLP